MEKFQELTNYRCRHLSDNTSVILSSEYEILRMEYLRGYAELEYYKKRSFQKIAEEICNDLKIPFDSHETGAKVAIINRLKETL